MGEATFRRFRVRQQYTEVFGTVTPPGAAVPLHCGQAATLRTARSKALFDWQALANGLRGGLGGVQAVVSYDATP
jgi:hypothetical protein